MKKGKQSGGNGIGMSLIIMRLHVCLITVENVRSATLTHMQMCCQCCCEIQTDQSGFEVGLVTPEVLLQLNSSTPTKPKRSPVSMDFYLVGF